MESQFALIIGKTNLQVTYLLVEIRRVFIFTQHNIRVAAVTCVIYSPQTNFMN
jgi:hypothetical protein